VTKMDALVLAPERGPACEVPNTSLSYVIVIFPFIVSVL